MRKFMGSFLLFVFVAILSSCGGGGGGGAPVASSSSFTALMLDVEPIYFISYAGKSDGSTSAGVTQMTLDVSGSGGAYVATVSESYFDASDNFVSTTNMYLNCDLNIDETLTCTNYLDASNIIDFTCTDDVSTHLTVDGVDQSSDSWQDDWYKSQPAGWLSAYSPKYQMLRSGNFASGTQSYNGWLQLIKDGQSINPSEFVSVSVADSTVTPVALGSSGVSDNTYVLASCLAFPCTWSSIIEVGAYFSLNTTPPPLDDYVVTVNLLGGGTIETTIGHEESLILPYVDATSMQAAWQGGDLVLNWTNPTGATNWDRVTQLRMVLIDSTNNLVGSVKVDPANSTITLSAALIADMYSVGNGTLADWSIQTRTYAPANPTNMQIARAYSFNVALPAPP